MKAGARVAVLMGGWSEERAVSLVSGRACAAALRELGYEVVDIDVGRDIAAILAQSAVDVAFNALHGRFGEDGCIQGLMEIMGIAYTHSGPLASAVAMHKPTAKRLLQAAGIRVPHGLVVDLAQAASAHALEPPYVVKPAAEGSSVGVHIVRPGDNRYPDQLGKDWHYGSEVMVETFIPGRELTVAVMDDRPLAVTEIRAAGTFYDYDSKYAEGGSYHIVPAVIPDIVAGEACEMALAAHRALGCRGVTRTDFRYDDLGSPTGGLFALEVNTQPGMTPTSLVPEQAACVGLSFKDLVSWIVEDASCGR